ncbi:MAG: DUF190 domain-containing protein [Acidobacteria bacterium]|nr:DUF190 domain-containing protein [Acidobacteriota bacterium]
MAQAIPGSVLRVHIRESDRHQGRPLHEVLVETCRRQGIAGATVLRGLEGYGEFAEIHRHHALSHTQPVALVIVDTRENIARLVPVIEALLTGGGLLTVDEAEIRRVVRPAT